MDRNDIATILGIAPEDVRIIPTALGGGFGAKLDLSIQPFVAIAAWHLKRPVRMVYTRSESIMATTKRHPARMWRVGATRDGRLSAIDFAADFNTGAYSSWGPTVAHRVPVHASGPYVPHYRRVARAVHTHLVPAGAFRGFGVPQAPSRRSRSMTNWPTNSAWTALNSGSPTRSLRANRRSPAKCWAEGVGIGACLKRFARTGSARGESLQRWAQRADPAGRRRRCHVVRLRQHIALEQPLHRPRRSEARRPLRLHQGAVDIGQGSNTIITQICADALGAPIARFDLVSAIPTSRPIAGRPLHRGKRS